MIKLHSVQKKDNVTYCIDSFRLEAKGGETQACVEGWALFDDDNSILSAKADNDSSKAELSFVERQDVVDAMGSKADPKKAGFIVKTPFSGDSKKRPLIELSYRSSNGNETVIFKDHFPEGEMETTGDDDIFLALDSAVFEKKVWTVRGWAFAEKKDEKGTFVPVDIKASFKGKPIESTLSRHMRADVVYPGLSKEYNAGFSLSFEKGKGAENDIKLSFSTAGGTLLYRGITGIHDDKEYEEKRKSEKATEEELSRQRQERFSYAPLISILVPVYKTDPKKLSMMIDSVLSQTYKNLELCIADASCDGDKKRERILKNYSKKDARVKVKVLSENLGIAENTNRAMELSKGEWIALLDHDDVLEPDALYRMVETMQDSDVEMVYTDEDKMDGDRYFEPHYKADFDMDLLYTNNYICHFLAVKRSLISDGESLLDSRYNGAQDYDLVLRCSERAKKVSHIKKVLYHWRAEAGSTSVDPSSKTYAFDAGLLAVNDSLKRTGKNAHAEKADIFFTYRVVEGRE